MFIKRVLNDNAGSIMISVILGLGLAAIFRKACSGGSCIVVRHPDLGELKKYVYRMDGSCFKYTPHVVPCPVGGGSS